MPAVLHGREAPRVQRRPGHVPRDDRSHPDVAPEGVHRREREGTHAIHVCQLLPVHSASAGITGDDTKEKRGLVRTPIAVAEGKNVGTPAWTYLQRRPYGGQCGRLRHPAKA